MYSLQRRDVAFSDTAQTVWRCRRRCAATVIVVLGLTAACAVFPPPSWLASQAIIVRDDATARFDVAARAREGEDVKNTQEVLQEIVAGRSLLRDSLRRVGPDANAASPNWPSEEAIVELRREVSLAPPKGAEFGKTAVFYLKVKDRDRDRAIRLTDAIYDELAKAFGRLRAAMNENAISELKASVALTEANLAQATRRLTEVEKQAGVDLVALRMLHQSPVGEVPIYHALSSGLDELSRCRQEQAQQTAVGHVAESPSEPAAPARRAQGIDRLPSRPGPPDPGIERIATPLVRRRQQVLGGASRHARAPPRGEEHSRGHP